MLYVIQREDVEAFSPAKEIDKKYSQKLKEVFDIGVEVLAYQLSVNPNEISLKQKLPIIW